jgi:dihydrodipicolinate reductase
VRGVHAGKQSEEDGLCEGGTRRQTVRGGWIVAVKAVYVAEESEQCRRLRGLHHEQTEQWNYLGGEARAARRWERRYTLWTVRWTTNC